MEEQSANPKMEEQRANPTIKEQRANPTIEEQRANPTIEEQRANPIMEEQRSNPIMEEQRANPTIEEQRSNPIMEEQRANPIMEDQRANPKNEEQRDNPIMEEQRLRVRMSLEDLDRPENKQKKNDFLKAWKIIQSLPPDNPNSFWAIASFHGMPFKKRVENNGEGDYWGGYCQHGNVLFPTWHRLYTLKLEMALQTAVPDGDVALHYWDETSDYCLQNGLPEILTDKTVIIDGKKEKNPLLSFVLNKEIDGDSDSLYKKPKSYETKRYPFSGIVNPLQAFEIAQEHNNQFNESADPKLLNENIKYWLNSGLPREIKENANSVLRLYNKCLQEQDYNKFSNTSSAALDGIFYTVEQPHNDIHLAVGGFTSSHESIGLIQGSNGDMGENETAAFDPIFFLHHCFIDRTFWMWQKKWNHSSVQTSFEIYEEKSTDNKPTGGTSTDAQGPTPTQKKGEVLTMDTILYPFQNSMGVLQTSRDCVDIEKQLGYTYDLSSGSSKIYLGGFKSELKSKSFKRMAFNENSLYEMSSFMRDPVGIKYEQKRKCFVDITKVKESEEFWKQLHFGEKETFTFGSSNWLRKFHLRVENIDSNKYSGSILVRTFYMKGNDTVFIGEKGILGRWEKNTCRNCQSRRFKSVHFAFGKLVIDFPLETNHFKTEIIWKNPYTGLNETSLICDEQIEEHPKRSIFVTFKEL